MSGDKIVEAVLRLLEIAVWPAFFGLLVWCFREEVKRAAARIIELGLTGAKFAPPSPPDQIPAKPTVSVSEGVGSAQGVGAATGVSSGAAVLVAAIKAKFSEDQLAPIVQELRHDPKIGSSPQDQVESLLYFSASLSVQLGHERNYRMIFGSQLQLLEMMNADVGVSKEAAKSTYDAARTAYSDVYRSITFEQWIGFLINAGLCNVAPNGNYVLTPYGRGFLRYIVDMHLPTNKPF